MSIIEKYSDTEVKIVSEAPFQSVGDIRPLSDLINRVSFLDENIADTQKLLSDRIATFQLEKDTLNSMIEEAQALGVVDTVVETVEE